MRQIVSETLEVFRLELLYRASTYGDQEAWSGFQQSLEETVLSWFHDHLASEAACRSASDRQFVALAFERLRQAVFQREVPFDTLSAALVYLHASLNGAILETLRVSTWPEVLSQRISGERDPEGHPDSHEIWDLIQAKLSSARECRLAYLLYHCGMDPAEIVRSCPQEWSDVQEVMSLRRSILARLMKGYDQ